MPKPRRLSKAFVFMLALSALALPLRADRTQLKPGFNLFSTQQDIEMGREVSRQAEQQLSVLNNRQAQAYIDSLGRRLAAHAPGGRYPYQFRIVNDKAINAFALPGGFVYVNRGAIEAARNESELAAVMAHEISHVALRHGTNQVSKQYALSAPLQLFGGAMGSNSVGSVLAQLGLGFAANSILLKYSRTAESQADLMGAQIMYDTGYDPRAMVSFFETLQNQSKGRPVEFFSDHPNPENRIGHVQQEIVKLGGSPRQGQMDSSEFQQVKSLVSGMSAGSSRRAGAGSRDRGTGGRPASPSRRLADLRLRDMTLSYPDNWRNYGEGSAVTLAPDGGIISGSLAYGMMVAEFEPDDDRYQRATLENATDQLLDDLRRTNPKMRIVRQHERIRVGGQPALSTELSNDSPGGGRESNWLVTVLQPNGILEYFVGVAPQDEYRNYQYAFEDIIDSVRFR
jgi:Zn-dependent protease with chaperone function